MSVLRVKDLKKSFGKDPVLNGVSFEINKGEVLSIIGPSGGGKSTLLRCLNFLEIPDSGEIEINNNLVFSAEDDKEPFTDFSYQNHIGLVFQQFNLFPQYTVLNNICLAPMLQARNTPNFNQNKEKIYAEIRENAAELIRKVGLEDKAEVYPCELSGGQQQRAAIARALALSPSILCFDEPTSALDPGLTGEVLKVIKGLKDFQHTMVVVTHEMDFARDVSDKVIFMLNGRVEETGTPQKLFYSPDSEKTKAFLKK